MMVYNFHDNIVNFCELSFPFPAFLLEFIAHFVYYVRLAFKIKIFYYNNRRDHYVFFPYPATSFIVNIL